MMKRVLISSVLVIVCYISNSEGFIEGSVPNMIKNDPIIISNENASTKESHRNGKSLHKECTMGSLSAKCLKIHALSFIEDLSSREELSLLPGLSIVKEKQAGNASTAEEVAAELSRQFPGKPEEKLNRFLLYRLQEYLDRHSLKYRLLDPQTTKEAMDMAKGDTASVGRKSGGGGGGLGGGKGGGGGALLAAALMMKGKPYFEDYDPL